MGGGLTEVKSQISKNHNYSKSHIREATEIVRLIVFTLATIMPLLLYWIKSVN